MEDRMAKYAKITLSRFFSANQGFMHYNGQIFEIFPITNSLDEKTR